MLTQNHLLRCGHYFCLRTTFSNKGKLFHVQSAWYFSCLPYDHGIILTVAFVATCFYRKYRATLMTCLIFDPITKVQVCGYLYYYCLYHLAFLFMLPSIICGYLAAMPNLPVFWAEVTEDIGHYCAGVVNMQKTLYTTEETPVYKWGYHMTNTWKGYATLKNSELSYLWDFFFQNE